MNIIRRLVLLVASATPGDNDRRITWGRATVGAVITFNVMILGFPSERFLLRSLITELERSLGGDLPEEIIRRLAVLILLFGSFIVAWLYSQDASPPTTRGRASETALYFVWVMPCTAGQLIASLYFHNPFLSIPTTVVATALYLYFGTRAMNRTIAREAAEAPPIDR